MICTKCGAQNKDNSKFCIECGSLLSNGNPSENFNPNIQNASKALPTSSPKNESSKLIILIIKILYVIFAAFTTFVCLFIEPQFKVAVRDLIIFRAHSFSFMLIALLLPGIIILIPSLRRKIPLFKKNKIGYTILGWIILFFIGCISLSVFNAMYSPEYKLALTAYNSEIALQREEANASKAQAKLSAASSRDQAQSEAAASKDQVASEAAASKVQAESEAAASKAQAASEAAIESLSKIPKIGDKVDVGEVSYVVEKIETSQTAGGEYLNTTAKGVYMIVSISITNNSNEALTISESFFKIICGEKEYLADSAATLYASDDQSLWFDSINPDLTTTGVVVFDVSQAVVDSSDTMLQVQTGFWGTQTGMIRLSN